MKFYDVNVNYGSGSYSFGLKSEKGLSDAEIISLAITQNKFEQKGDAQLIDSNSITEITEKQYNERFNN